MNLLLKGGWMGLLYWGWVERKAMRISFDPVKETSSSGAIVNSDSGSS